MIFDQNQAPNAPGTICRSNRASNAPLATSTAVAVTIVSQRRFRATLPPSSSKPFAALYSDRLLVSDWTSSDTYLRWAHDSLAQNTPLGFDAALCYAKRSACREIDAFMVCNHFSRFRG